MKYDISISVIGSHRPVLSLMGMNDKLCLSRAKLKLSVRFDKLMFLGFQDERISRILIVYLLV